MAFPIKAMSERFSSSTMQSAVSNSELTFERVGGPCPAPTVTNWAAILSVPSPALRAHTRKGWPQRLAHLSEWP